MKFENLRRNSKVEVLATTAQKGYLKQLIEKHSRVFLSDFNENINFETLTKKQAAEKISMLRDILGDDIE